MEDAKLNQLNTRIVLRNDSTANWDEQLNTVLLKGEVGVEFQEDGKAKLKVGDGVTAWKDLDYLNSDIQQILTAGEGIIFNDDGTVTYDPEIIATVEYVDANISDTMAYIMQEDAAERAGRIAGDNLKVDKKIDGENGKALIFNEADGGGAKFEAENGIWAYAGVNDATNAPEGTKRWATMYVKDTVGGDIARIGLNETGAFYVKNTGTMTAADEIAVKGDIDGALTDYLTKEEAQTDYVAQEEGKRLITANEANKLAALVVGEGGQIEISGIVNAENVQDLYDVVKDIVTGIGTEEFDGELVNKLGIAPGAQVNVLEAVKVNGTALTITDKAVNLPLATDDTIGLVKGADEENGILVDNTGAMHVKSVNVNKLVQTEGEYVILNGGNAAGEY